MLLSFFQSSNVTTFKVTLQFKKESYFYKFYNFNRLPQIADMSRSATPRKTKQVDQSKTSQLAANFASLYSQTCIEALDTLEQTWEDGQSESVVKSKVLFAIIVVSSNQYI